MGLKRNRIHFKTLTQSVSFFFSGSYFLTTSLSSWPLNQPPFHIHLRVFCISNLIFDTANPIESSPYSNFPQLSILYYSPNKVKCPGILFLSISLISYILFEYSYSEKPSERW